MNELNNQQNPPTDRPSMPSSELVEIIVKALTEKKAQDIVVVDVREQSNLTDYYVVASGLSAPHLKAIQNDVQVSLKNNYGVVSHRRCGAPDGGWMVLDYFDVIIHVLLPESREYYALEELWANPPTEEEEEA
jgi:ribosome-associated protein